MDKQKYLSKRQLTVLEDLFNSELNEQGVLEKHRVRRSTYERWLEDELFSERFNRYANNARRRSELLLAKYRYLAAAKLVELTTSEKAETARKACLDIICQPQAVPEDKKDSEKQAVKPEVEQLSGEQASRLLAAMAEEKILK